MSKVIALVDLDGTIVEPGTRNIYPGARLYLEGLSQRALIYFFSCWAFTDSDLDWLKEQFPFHAGVIKKPFAESSYVFIDDKHAIDLSAREQFALGQSTRSALLRTAI